LKPGRAGLAVGGVCRRRRIAAERNEAARARIAEDIERPDRVERVELLVQPIAAILGDEEREWIGEAGAHVGAGDALAYVMGMGEGAAAGERGGGDERKRERAIHGHLLAELRAP
jgi:hypothetical protein